MKNIYLFLIIASIFYGCDYTGLTVVNEIHEEQEGSLIFEAEHPNETAGNSVNWSTDRENNTTYVKVEKKNSDTDSLEAALKYKLQINNPGIYSIWVKVKGPTGGNSMAIEVNGNNINLEQKDSRYEDFMWINRNARYKFSTGEHTLSLLYTDEDFHPDSIMLLHDQLRRPAGNVETTSVMEDSDKILDALISGRKNQQLLQPLSNTYGNYSLAEAYALQRKLAERLKADLGEIVGYKLAFATDDAMENFKLNEPVYGPFLEKQEIKNGDEIDLNTFMQFHIENEIAFVLASDITEPVESIESLRSYVKSIHLSFDMADGRFDRTNGREGANDFIASGGGAHRFMLGDPIDGTDHDLSGIFLKIHHNDTLIYDGNTDNVYGNPWKALQWVVNDLIENGQPVKENMVFISGKVDAPYTPEGDKATGSYTGTADQFPNVECTVVK